VSSITVRGPSPLYHPNFETEDYQLDGSDLVALDAKGDDLPPLYKGGPIVSRVGTKEVPGPRLFHPRNTSEGLIIRRFGESPDKYYWEVWNPHTGITRLYGGQFLSSSSAVRAPSDNGLLRGDVPLAGGVRKGMIGEWALTEEFDNQPAHSGSKYTYISDRSVELKCRLPGDFCSPALRLQSVEYNLVFGPNSGDGLTGVTRIEFEWLPRGFKRFNTDGRFGFLRASEYWLKAIDVIYRPDSSHLWLASAGPESEPYPDNQIRSGYVLFAQHRFEPFFTAADQFPKEQDQQLAKDADEQLTKEADCANSDILLSSYLVRANSNYDVSDDLKSQTFKFSYKGGRPDSKGNCAPDTWYTESSPAPGSPDAPNGMFPFPQGLLSGLGFSQLTKSSLLGTSQASETGASLYVGIGPLGNVASKENTGGFKGGIDFSQFDGTSTLVDITGSGIPAVVFKDGENHLSYCIGIRDDINTSHPVKYPADPSQCGTINGIGSFSFGNSSSQSSGVEGYAGSNVFGGVSFSQSQNQTFTYFADVDGDGLIDIVDHGQVYYNQGEVIATDSDGKIKSRTVQFTPNSALRPPVPGRSKSNRTTSPDFAVGDAYIPQSLRETITSIESRLAQAAKRLQELQYSQTTIAWEAPLDGQITISGTLQQGISGTEWENEGPLGNFGPREFEELFAKSQLYQKNYTDAKSNCSIWLEDSHCHDQFSDPFSLHYASPAVDIGFLSAPQSRLQVFLSQLDNSTPISCSDALVYPWGIDLSSIPFASLCHPNSTNQRLISVKAGDVIYLTYSVHPNERAFMLPDEVISYVAVDDDPLFTAFQSGGSDALPAAFGCRFEEEQSGNSHENCLLAKQRRYSFNLSEGLIPSRIARLAESFESPPIWRPIIKFILTYWVLNLRATLMRLLIRIRTRIRIRVQFRPTASPFCFDRTFPRPVRSRDQSASSQSQPSKRPPTRPSSRARRGKMQSAAPFFRQAQTVRLIT